MHSKILCPSRPHRRRGHQRSRRGRILSIRNAPSLHPRLGHRFLQMRVIPIATACRSRRSRSCRSTSAPFTRPMPQRGAKVPGETRSTIFRRHGNVHNLDDKTTQQSIIKHIRRTFGVYRTKDTRDEHVRTKALNFLDATCIGACIMGGHCALGQRTRNGRCLVA